MGLKELVTDLKVRGPLQHVRLLTAMIICLSRSTVNHQ